MSKERGVVYRFGLLAVFSLGLVSSTGCGGSVPQDSASSEAESLSEAEALPVEERVEQMQPHAGEPAVATSPSVQAPAVSAPPAVAPSQNAEGRADTRTAGDCRGGSTVGYHHGA